MVFLNVRCGHCQRLAPTWDELAAHFEKHSSVHISKLDCTLHSSTCQRQGVKGYPTLLLFVNGEVQDKYSGNRELEDLVEFVNRASEDSPQHNQQVFLTSINQATLTCIITVLIYYREVWWNWMVTAFLRPFKVLVSLSSSSMRLGVVTARGWPPSGIN